MYKIEYQNKIYEGATEKELFSQLRKSRLTHREIAEIVGKKKQWVSKVLGPTGRLEFPELNNPTLFQDSDETISITLGLPVSRISAARRRLGLKSRVRVDVNQRRKRLAYYLFASLPGPNFVEFIKEQIDRLPTGKQKVMQEFYIDGVSQSLADGVNSDSDRVYRHLARKELKENVVEYDIEELIQRGVISEKD